MPRRGPWKTNKEILPTTLVDRVVCVCVSLLYPTVDRAKTVESVEVAFGLWHQLGHMQVCISLQTDNDASTPPLSFLQAGRPSNSVKALKAFCNCNTVCNCIRGGPTEPCVIRWEPRSLGELAIFGRGHPPAHCEEQGIFSVSKSYAVGGSSDAAFRARCCSKT